MKSSENLTECKADLVKIDKRKEKFYRMIIIEFEKQSLLAKIENVEVT